MRFLSRLPTTRESQWRKAARDGGADDLLSSALQKARLAAAALKGSALASAALPKGRVLGVWLMETRAGGKSMLFLFVFCFFFIKRRANCTAKAASLPRRPV